MVVRRVIEHVLEHLCRDMFMSVTKHEQTIEGLLGSKIILMLENWEKNDF